jgi:hypothetical protein
MAVNKIKSFLHIEKMQQTSLMEVTYYWEIKLAYVEVFTDMLTQHSIGMK